MIRAGQAEQREKSIPGRKNSSCQAVKGRGHGLSIQGHEKAGAAGAERGKEGALTTQLTVAATRGHIVVSKAQESRCGGVLPEPPLTSVGHK